MLIKRYSNSQRNMFSAAANSSKLSQASNQDALTALQAGISTIGAAKEFQALYQLVVTKLLPYLDLYNIGDFTKLDNTYTLQTHNALAVLLVNNSNYMTSAINSYVYTETTFSEIKKAFIKILNGLQKGSIQNRELICTKLLFDLNNEILSDPYKLVAYYNEKFNSYGALHNLNANISINVPLVVKSQYALYCERYGLPINGIFDAEKMAIILLELRL